MIFQRWRIGPDFENAFCGSPGTALSMRASTCRSAISFVWEMVSVAYWYADSPVRARDG